MAAGPVIASGGTSPFSQVVVVNPASSPVPVALQGTGTVQGTVTVGNASIPVTQSGTWTLQSDDATTVIASGSLVVGASSTGNLVTDFDFTPYKEMQVYVRTFNVSTLSSFFVSACGTPCGPLLFDGGSFDSFGNLTKTYGLLPPHTNIVLENNDINHAATYIYFVLGRRN